MAKYYAIHHLLDVYVTMAYNGDHLLNRGENFQLPLLVFLGIEHPWDWYTECDVDPDTWIANDSLGDDLQPEVDKLEPEFHMYRITIEAHAEHYADRILEVLEDLAKESVSTFLDSASAVGIEELSISPDDYNFFFHLVEHRILTIIHYPFD